MVLELERPAVVVGRFIVRLIRHSKRISLVRLRSTKGVNAGLVIGILYKASRLARTLMRLALARGGLSDAGRPGGLYGIDFEWPEPVTQSSVILITTNFGLSLALIRFSQLYWLRKSGLSLPLN